MGHRVNSLKLARFYPLWNRTSEADPGFRVELFLDNFTADEVVKKSRVNGP